MKLFTKNNSKKSSKQPTDVWRGEPAYRGDGEVPATAQGVAECLVQLVKQRHWLPDVPQYFTETKKIILKRQ